MNTYRVDLNLLAVFHAILETRSVTLAAEKFGITQPAMSNALTRLRELMGDPLFVHTSTGMQATPYALEIAGPIADALNGFQKAINHRDSFDPMTSSRTFRFHITDMGQINILPALLERLHVVAPGIKVEAETLSLDEIRTRLEDGRVDFSVGHLPKLQGRNIRFEKLFQERYVVLMRAGHPAASPTLTQKTYLNAAHAIVTSVGGGHHIVEETLIKKRARIIARLPNIMAISMILSRTDLIATIPRRVATELAKTSALKVCALPVSMPEFDVTVFWHERSDAGSADAWMRDQLIDLFAVKGKP
jgi:DNA-binding transcriptional LysR family regulator